LVCGMGIWLWRRLGVRGWLVVILWLLISAPTGWTATSAAAFAALVTTAEAIDDASQDADNDNCTDDDADDNGPSKVRH
jgi:hypothetical protein